MARPNCASESPGFEGESFFQDRNALPGFAHAQECQAEGAVSLLPGGNEVDHLLEIDPGRCIVVFGEATEPAR